MARTAGRRTLTLACLAALAVALPCAGAGEGGWEARLEAKLTELREQGQPVTVQELMDGLRPMPDEENAALILLRAFELMEPADDDPWGMTHADPFPPELGVRRSPPVHELGRRWLADTARALELIHEAAALPGGRYPVEVTDNPFMITLEHLAKLREAARLCVRSAAFHADERDGQRAAQALADMLGLSRSLGENVFLIDVLVRIAVDGMFADALERSLALCEMPPERLSDLRAAIAREAGSLSVRQALITERAAAHYYFVEAPLGELRDALGDTKEGPLAFLTYGRAARARDALYYYDLMERMITICELPPRRRLQAARSWAAIVEEQQDSAKYRLSGLVMPALSRSIEQQVKGLALLSVAGAGLAVEQSRIERGRWPASLDELVPGLLDAVPEDPFRQGTLRYARTDDGVVVYSVGLDGTDDGGLTRAAAEEAAGEVLAEGWDIVFRLLAPERRGARQLTFDAETDAHGISPLHAAVQMGHIEVVKALLAQGADVHATDDEGRTPLHVAVSIGRRDIAEQLIEAGADVNAVDFDGRTPTGLAAERGHNELAAMLGERGGVE